MPEQTDRREEPWEGGDAPLPASPLAKTWWVEPGRLLAGPYPYDLVTEVGRQRLMALLGAGILTWISLQEPDETGTRGSPFADYEAAVRELARGLAGEPAFMRFPIRDMDVCPDSTMAGVLDAIDASLDAGRPVYLHCWGGHGRTGTVVGCWLVRHGLPGPKALERIAALRRGDDLLAGWLSPQTEAQRRMVLRWAAVDPALRNGNPTWDPGGQEAKGETKGESNT